MNLVPVAAVTVAGALRWGAGLLLAGAAAGLAWLVAHAWRFLLALRRAAAAAAPGGTVGMMTVRLAGLEGRLDAALERLDRLEALSDAKEHDDRQRHEADVGELLGSLLEMNQALRIPLAVRPQADHPAPAAAGAPPGSPVPDGGEGGRR